MMNKTGEELKKLLQEILKQLKTIAKNTAPETNKERKD